MWVTGTVSVYTRFCDRIREWDCMNLDFWIFCEYNSLMKI